MHVYCRHRTQGFTLIEILLALSILVIGLVGILAIFPIGINSSRSAVEQSQAAILAESVKDSVVYSFWTASSSSILMAHDGIGNGVTFKLPPAGKVLDLPFDTDNADTATKNRKVFVVGDKVVPGTYDNNFQNQAGFMNREPDEDSYHQYSFRIQVQKDVSSALVTNLYLVHVHVYRHFDSNDWNRDLNRDANHTGERGSARIPVTLIGTYKTQVASR